MTVKQHQSPIIVDRAYQFTVIRFYNSTNRFLNSLYFKTIKMDLNINVLLLLLLY